MRDELKTITIGRTIRCTYLIAHPTNSRTSCSKSCYYSKRMQKSFNKVAADGKWK